jgi:hypothetical protein
MKTPISALAEKVDKNNGPKGPKAKQIFLGIDAHLGRNQAARKMDNGGIQAVQSFRFEELLLFVQKQLSLAKTSAHLLGVPFRVAFLMRRV